MRFKGKKYRMSTDSILVANIFFFYIYGLHQMWARFYEKDQQLCTQQVFLSITLSSNEEVLYNDKSYKYTREVLKFE